jgi:hypothetical protein
MWRPSLLNLISDIEQIISEKKDLDAASSVSSKTKWRLDWFPKASEYIPDDKIAYIFYAWI